MRRTIKSRGDDKLVLLDDSAVVCRGLRIVGSTLWTHMPPHALLETAKAESPEYLVNDYRRIMQASAPKEHSEADTSATPSIIKCITAAHTNAWHRAGVAAIERAAAAADAAGECLLVLTHHAPSFRGTSRPPPPPCDDA